MGEGVYSGNLGRAVERHSQPILVERGLPDD
jgi:hypothetical protein